MDPPRFLTPGDVGEVEIEGIGTISNPVVSPGDERRLSHERRAAARHHRHAKHAARLNPEIDYPKTVEDLLAEAKRCQEAGASILHFHGEEYWTEAIETPFAPRPI